MEQVNECLKCIELKKSLEVEKKKVTQKNRLITLLRELVRSYEAKDLNITFNDLSRIYESSSSEVTILKQRLTLYLNENQELLQLKNDISSRNDLLEKKCRDIEDEIAHLRFVNKQLGDYYREKEADHDQHKDRLKKLARKLLSYEPKNSEARKILNLQNTPIDLEPKALKNGHKKKNEEIVKEMKIDNIEDHDTSTVMSKPSDMNSEEPDLSDNSDCDNDTDYIETNNLSCIEECSNPPSPEPLLSDTEVNKMSHGLTPLHSCDDQLNSQKSCEITRNPKDGIIDCEESNGSNGADIIIQNSSYKNISIDAPSEIYENNIKSSKVLHSVFEEDSCNYENVSEQNEIDTRHKDINDFLEFEDSLPDLISPLKSDETRVLSYLDRNPTLSHETVIQNNCDHVDSNKEVIKSTDDCHEKVSTDIKNECSSNSGDQVEKKKKSPSRSTYQSKYQTLNDGLLFTEKPINGGHMPLNENYASNYQFQSSHCFGCCNNSFDAIPPLTLKLYNCTNVEISIPPVMQKQNLPIITVRDKCDLNKCYINTSNGVSKLIDPSPVHSSVISDKRNEEANDNYKGQHNTTVLSNNRWLNRSNGKSTENIKDPSNPNFQDSRVESKSSDYFFLDYLTNNKIEGNIRTFRKQSFGDSESGPIKCARLFPIRVDKQFDLEHFCYRFRSLSLKYSLPEPASKVYNLNKMNNTNNYSSLFNISQPPVFHNSLKSSVSSNCKNDWIFGNNFLNGTVKRDICNKTGIKLNSSSNTGTEENSTNRIKQFNIMRKSVLDLKSSFKIRTNINDVHKIKAPGYDSVQNPFNKICEINEFKGSQKCLNTARVRSMKKGETVFDKKETIFEGRQKIQSQCSMETLQVPFGDVNPKPFRNNSFKLQTSQLNGANFSVTSGKSESLRVSNNEDSSKSIFDLDQGKDSYSSVSNDKSKFISTSHLLTQESADGQIQKQTLLNSDSPTGKVVAETHSKPPVKEHRKENLLRERPSFLKEKSPKKLKHSDSELSQSKNHDIEKLSSVIHHDDLFKKPDAVNTKEPRHLKITENKFKCNSVINEVQVAVKGKSKVDSPKKNDQLCKINKNKSSPDVKRHCNKKNLSQQYEFNEESKTSNVTISKLHAKCVVPIKNSVGISQSFDLDEEDENKSDHELHTIFKEMIDITVPLLSPLTKTPEIFAEEIPDTSEIKVIEGNSKGLDVVESDKIVKTKEESKTKCMLEDEETISSLKSPMVNEEKIATCTSISDNEEIASHEEGPSMQIKNSVNNKALEDIKIGSCTENLENLVNEEFSKSAEIEHFKRTEEIKIYSRKRKKSSDNPNEADNDAAVTSSAEFKSKISMETTPTADHNCSSKDVESSTNNKAKFGLSPGNENKLSGGPGFYVSRIDDENTISPSAPVMENSQAECSTTFDNLNSNNSNVAPDDIPSIDCDLENNSRLNTEEMLEGMEIPSETDDSLVCKRKHRESNEDVEGMCSKKQKMLSDDEFISCESDVFICALRYLSAAAVASFDGKVCTLPKTNSDVNLPSKIAINHIKNLIIEAFQSFDSKSYDVLNCSVKKIMQINDASPVTLAKAIIEVIVESNDKSEAKDKPYMPSMSKTIKMCLLTAVSFIGYNRDFVMQFCEVFEQHISSFYDKSLTVAEGSQLVIFYTSFCRSYNLDDKVKYLIYDVLYTRNIKAYPMVYKTIQTWPDILPHSDTCFAKDCLLTQTITFILLSGASSVDEKVGNMYCINNIRSYLYKYFGYKCNFIRREELTDKIIEKIDAKGGNIALVLLCKCEPWEWSSNLVEKKLLPVLQSSRPMKESTICEYILAIARVVRGFPITKAAHIVKNTLEVFEHMLLESNSTYLSEIIVEAISLLRRHNLMKCTSILMNWKPNTKQITKKTINHISSILRVKNVGYWKNVYSAHSSNIIHNTRTFRKKKKVRFLISSLT